MKIQDFLFLTYMGEYKNRPVLHCNDGFRVSVQASGFHYCSPRETGRDISYSAVELGYPSKKEALLMDFAEDPTQPTNTVYAQVDIQTLHKVIEGHGGIDVQRTFQNCMIRPV